MFTVILIELRWIYFYIFTLLFQGNSPKNNSASRQIELTPEELSLSNERHLRGLFYSVFSGNRLSPVRKILVRYSLTSMPFVCAVLIMNRQQHRRRLLSVRWKTAGFSFRWQKALPLFRLSCCLSESADLQEKHKDNSSRFEHTEPLWQDRFPVKDTDFDRAGISEFEYIRKNLRD